jgi:hypothetical protein
LTTEFLSEYELLKKQIGIIKNFAFLWGDKEKVISKEGEIGLLFVYLSTLIYSD